MQFVFKGNFKGNSVRKGAEFFRLLLPSYRFCDTICGVKGKKYAPERSLYPYEGAICK